MKMGAKRTQWRALLERVKNFSGDISKRKMNIPFTPNIPNSEENLKLLLDFGLTINQAKVYLVIARIGTIQVGQISKISKVRREDVYRTLPKLERMGLIERMLGTPVKVRATPVNESLTIIIGRERDEREKKISDLRSNKEILLRMLKNSLQKTEIIAEPSFALIQEKDGIIEKGLTMLENVEKEVRIATSRKELPKFLSLYEDSLKKSLEKGSKILIATESAEGEQNMEMIRKLTLRGDLRVKCVPEVLCHYMIIDDKEVIVSTSKESHLAEVPSLFTDNNSLIQLFRKDFERTWLI